MGQRSVINTVPLGRSTAVELVPVKIWVWAKVRYAARTLFIISEDPRYTRATPHHIPEKRQGIVHERESRPPLEPSAV